MYLCMSEIRVGRDTTITHGKALTKDTAESAAADAYRTNICSIVSWVERADIPHKCNVYSCTLNRIYLTNKLWGVALKLVLYDECNRFLYTKLPNDIVLYILEKCFCRKRLRNKC